MEPVQQQQQKPAGSITTRNVALLAGALVKYPSAELHVNPANTPGAAPTFTVDGLPPDFSEQVARGEIHISLREQIAWESHILALNRESRKRGGHA